MMNEAKQHQADDQNHKELIEARNTADSIAYQTEKTLNDLGDKVPADERQNIETKVNQLRETLQSNDVQTIKSQTETLQNALHALSQQIDAHQQAETPGTGPIPGGNGHGPSISEDEVVEGEFREA